MVQISVHPYFLSFHRPFVLAHGTRLGTQLAFIRIQHDDIIAFGEASLPPYLSETFDSVSKWVMNQSELVTELLKKNPFENVSDIPFSKERPAASAGLQSAILNWYAASRETGLSDYFKSTLSKPHLSLTITKSDYDHLDEKLRLAQHFTVLKLKLTGSYDDLEFVQAVCKRSNMPFCVDVNQGCHSKEDAVKLIHALEAHRCMLVEQPLKDVDHEGHYWMKQRVRTPIIADESIRLFDDLVQYHEAYSGVNIKLMKCGGLIQAQQMLQFESSATDSSEFMRILGCMSESSLGISTASVLSSHCGIADLDSPYLSNNDPFEGFQIVNGKIEVEERVGLKKEVSLD